MIVHRFRTCDSAPFGQGDTGIVSRSADPSGFAEKAPARREGSAADARRGGTSMEPPTGAIMKTSMVITLVTALVICSCAGPRPAGEEDSEMSLVSIVEVEGSFARAAAQNGTRDAFLEFLAEDGVIFRPGPVNGAEWFAGNEASPGLLSWRPTYAEVARYDDIGYTTGPWELRREGSESDAVTHGHYVSIWRRGPEGKWRLLLDTGISHDPPRTVPSEVEFGLGAADDPESVPRADVEAERERLLAVDRVFSENSESFGAVAAYVSFATEDIRFYRMNVFPAKGKKELRKMLNAAPGLYTWEPAAAGVSRGGDLGYTYGSSKLEVSHVEETETERTETFTGEVKYGAYARIWRKDIDGNWNLALDIETPMPEP